LIIDLYIMPLSRYRAGDFIPPRSAAGEPEGVLMGGSGAAERRKVFIAETQRFMMTLPDEIADFTWNEYSDVPPRCYTVSSESFDALQQEGRRHLDKRPTLGALFGARRYRAQVARADVFLPTLFETMFDRAGERYGSTHTLLRELGLVEWSRPAREASKIMAQAGRDSVELRLPLIVSSEL